MFSFFKPKKQTDNPNDNSIEKINYIKRALCKLKIDDKFFSGFFRKINLGKGEKIYLAFTYSKIIEKNIMGKKIKIEFEGGKNWGKSKSIILDSKKRHIEIFPNPKDIVFIEMNNDENEKEIEPLIPDSTFYENFSLAKDHKIMILQFQKKNSLQLINSNILEVKGFEICYQLENNKLQPGSPMIEADSFKVLGIHKGENIDLKNQYGILIGAVLKEKINLLIQKKKNKKILNLI